MRNVTLSSVFMGHRNGMEEAPLRIIKACLICDESAQETATVSTWKAKLSLVKMVSFQAKTLLQI